MVKWLKDLARFCKDALWQKGRGVVTSLIWVLSIFGMLRSEALPSAAQDEWRVLVLIPKWDWHVWVIWALALTILVILYSVFEHHRKVCSELTSRHNLEREELGSSLVNATALLEKFNALPNLEGEIQDFSITTYDPPADSLSKRVRELSPNFVGSFIALRLYFTNTSAYPTGIKSFTLIIRTAHGEFASPYPIEGKIHQTYWNKPPNAPDGKQFDNLLEFSKSGQLATQGLPVNGHLRFMIEGLTQEKLGDTAEIAVIVTDAFGGTHLLTYKDSPLHPSDRLSI